MNLFFQDLVDAESGELKPDKELAKIIHNANIDTTLPTVHSCGSGVTACINDLAMRILGAEKSAIYDGSWSEYVSFKNFYLSLYRDKLMSQISPTAVKD